MDLTIGSSDDPGRFRPVAHRSVESRHDASLDTHLLPATRTEDNAAIAAKWKEAGVSIPD